MRLRLTLACGLYDRTMALQNGTVSPEGIDLNFLALGPGQLFRRQARHAEFDVAEFSLSTFCLLVARGDDRMVGIPVFPSRKFRHADIYVNKNSGIRDPKDLAGKRVGVQEYQQTAGIWMRGILREEYGVSPEDVHWHLGGYNAPRPYSERIPLMLPDGVQTTTIPADRSLNELLETRELDALMGASPPQSFTQKSDQVARLFAEPMEVEADYYRRTEIFPIMHLVVIKREIYDRAPWIAGSLVDAFERAKKFGLDRLSESGTLFCALPWLREHVMDVQSLLGPDPFAYGLGERNRRVLTTFLDYWYEQGLAPRPVSIDELFVPETL